MRRVATQTMRRAGSWCGVMLVLVLGWCGDLAAAQSALPQQVHGRSFDLVVIQATPGGIACAVRAAREGLSVLLVNHNEHVGGILSSGLGVWDTLHEGRRSPIYDDVRQAIFDHYRDTYGAGSPQYRAALPGRSGHTNGKFEPRVAEQVLLRLIAAEPNLTLLAGYVPHSVEREGRLLKSATLRELDGEGAVRVMGRVFADCSYEGDLLPLAGVAYRVGREARNEFDEPHAGVLFVAPRGTPPDARQARSAREHARLKLRKFSGFDHILPESTGAADEFVQAFNYRTVLTSEPDNRLPMSEPPGYDPDRVRPLEFGSIVQPLPNQKIGWNRPQLVGRQTDYVRADWAGRRRVMDDHWNATLQLLWFLQHDESVTPERREFWSRYGLARDEFADNDHRPYEIYVREARRLVGRYVLTEHDALLLPDVPRAPCHADSIAVTEWYLDTHACTPRRVAGSREEGKMTLHLETFPGHVPYRALLPQDVDNMLVPVCLSATHVAWGTVRLEPTWMHVGESAAFAAVQALREQQAPADIAVATLQQTLARRRVMLSYLNDWDVAADESWGAAVQFFGPRGFFHDYDCRPDEPVRAATAQLWLAAAAAIGRGEEPGTGLLQKVAAAERTEPRLTREEFARMFPGSGPDAGDVPPTRGKVLGALYRSITAP